MFSDDRMQHILLRLCMLWTWNYTHHFMQTVILCGIKDIKLCSSFTNQPLLQTYLREADHIIWDKAAWVWALLSFAKNAILRAYYISVLIFWKNSMHSNACISSGTWPSLLSMQIGIFLISWQLMVMIWKALQVVSFLDTLFIWICSWTKL